MAVNRFFRLVKSIIGQPEALGGLVVANCETLRDKDVRTFSIPRSDQRRSLKVGASAKILIEAKLPGGQVLGERPWVVVTEVIGSRYKVRLDNHLVIFPPVNDAEFVVGPENIIAVLLPDDFKLPYGKTCLVSSAVLEQDEWPGQAIKDAAAETGSHSGWRIFSEVEIPSAAHLTVPCHVLLAKFQVLDTILDEPGSSAWRWSASHNEFRSSDGASAKAGGTPR